MPMLIAQFLPGGPVYWVKLALVIAGVLAIAYIVLRVCKVTVPGWVLQIAGVLAAVLLGLIAIDVMVRAAGL